MSQSLYHYFERELTFIRQFAQEFAKQYPAAAARLLLEPNRSTDPHIERLIESFALLTGRIQHKIDDEFPELTTALLGVLHPHYLAPIPSMAIVQFDVDAARVRSPEGFTIPRQSRLSTKPVGDLPCRYRTSYPVSLWPVRVANAELMRPPFPRGMSPPRGAVAALQIQLECQGGQKFAELALDVLRFYLKGEGETIALLYELLFNHTIEVVFRDPSGAATSPPLSLQPHDCLAQVGFERDDGLLPYPPQSFVGYRLLSEFFAFPYKFHFVDLRGLRRVCRAGYQNQLEIVLFLNNTWRKLEQDVTAETFRLGCTPAINLFAQTAEPIAMSETRHEYRVVPDVAYPDGMEVYSVDQVTSVDPSRGRPRNTGRSTHWTTARRTKDRGISGTPCAGRRRACTIEGPRFTSAL
jgi:type VI secretion system protein ImpG